MIFLGNAFYSGDHSSDISPTDIKIDVVKLSQGIYDNLFISTSIKETKDDFVWDYDTVLYALFKGDLLAGNIGNRLDTITSIRIKQREKGTFKWNTVEEFPINSAEDLKIITSYKYCKSNTDYEFAIVPVLNGNIEGNINMAEVRSEFDGVYLIEKDKMAKAFMNVETKHQRNYSGTTVSTLGRKNPFYVSNSKSNYDSGTLSATFVQQTDNCNYDYENGYKYRQEIDDFLTDNKVKILKTEEGKIWLVCIVDNITQDSSRYYYTPIHSINWVEIGDYNSTEDLYINGLIDVH